MSFTHCLQKCISEGEEYVDLTVIVKCEASEEMLTCEADDLIYTSNEPCIPGRVNASLKRFLSQVLGIDTKSIEIVYGVRGSVKRVRIKGVTKDTLIDRLSKVLQVG